MRYRSLIVLLGAAAIGGTLLRAQRTPTPAAAQVPGTDARQAIDAARKAQPTWAGFGRSRISR